MINSRKKGFTIVELVIVVAVIAILAAVLIPTFSNLVKKANESADIQAVRNMNVYLAQAEATGDVNSILDVYEIFDESDYVVENYQPLYKGRYFYYDKQKNQILYVDDEDKVLFPTDSKGDVQGTNDWYSLSLEIKTEVVTPSSGAYTVSNAQQYAYVVEQLNKGITENITINITADLDFKGAQVTIGAIPEGKVLTINGNGKTLKNITSNTPMTVSNDNVNKVYNSYYCAGLVADCSGDLVINNINLENVNVKSINSSGVALLVGGTLKQINSESIKFNNVSVKNSNVIGNRNVGALIGYVNSGESNGVIASEIKLENVNVYTVVGSSGLLYGTLAGSSKDSPINITMTNCTFGVYKCELNTGTCKCNDACDTDGSDGAIHGYSYTSAGEKQCRVDKGVNYSPTALYYGYTNN